MKNEKNEKNKIIQLDTAPTGVRQRDDGNGNTENGDCPRFSFAFAGLLVLLTLLMMSATGLAGVLQTSPTLPPGMGQYEAYYHANYPQGVLLNDPIHSRFVNVVRNDDGSGNELETFDSTLEATADVPLMSMFDVPVMLTGPVTVRVQAYTSGMTGTFATEIISMSLSGDVGGMPVEVRESPNLPSMGQTTITDLGGGLWEIDSFFDVFTELSVNGGPFMGDLTGPARMTLTPEPGTLALLGLGALGVVRRRRRRYAA